MQKKAQLNNRLEILDFYYTLDLNFGYNLDQI